MVAPQVVLMTSIQNSPKSSRYSTLFAHPSIPVGWGRPLLSRPRGAVDSGPAAVPAAVESVADLAVSAVAWSCGCVVAEREKWETEEVAAATQKMAERLQAERAVTEAHVGEKRTAGTANLTSPPPRRSPRHQEPEAGGGGGKEGGGKGGGGKGSGGQRGGGKGVGGKGVGGPHRPWGSGGRGVAASSAAAPTSFWEIVEGATAKRAAEAGAKAAEAGAKAAALAEPASQANAGPREQGLPPAADGNEAVAAAQASEGVNGAAVAAGAELEEDEEMGEEDDEEALEGVPPEVLEDGQSPNQIDMALYAAALEGVGGSGKKSTGRSAKGKKGKAGPSSAGAGGKQPPTPVPMGTTPSIVKTRRSSPRSNNKDA